MVGNTKARFRFSLFIFLLWLCSCQKVDLFEKNVAIPRHAWQSNYRPEFRFTISDTSVPYNLYIVFRHSEKYNFNNIWLNLYTRIPGDTTVQKVQYELPLANSEGWLTNDAMDDLYEHRILITPGNERFYFKKPGEYIFTLEQIMREDPLENVFNVGLRLEKKLQ